MSLDRLLKSIKAAQPQVDLLNELQAELKDEIKAAGPEAAAFYNKHTTAVDKAIKSGDFEAAKTIAIDKQKELNKIIKNNAPKS